MAELVDAADSKSAFWKEVGVRFPLWASKLPFRDKPLWADKNLKTIKLMWISSSFFVFCIEKKRFQGVVQMARIQGWGSCGREFESHHPEEMGFVFYISKKLTCVSFFWDFVLDVYVAFIYSKIEYLLLKC